MISKPPQLACNYRWVWNNRSPIGCKSGRWDSSFVDRSAVLDFIQASLSQNSHHHVAMNTMLCTATAAIVPQQGL
jgi:hypothetical protein